MTRKTEKYLLAVIMLALAAGLCGVAFHWARVFMAPAEVPAPAAKPAIQLGAAAGRITAARLFGAPAAAPAATTVEVSNLRIRLKGVFAGRERGLGYAIVSTETAADAPVKVGAEVLPGVLLASVHPTYIVLNRAGKLERVDLLEKRGGPEGQPGTPRPASATPQFRKPATVVVPIGPLPSAVPAAPAPSAPPPEPEPEPPPSG